MRLSLILAAGLALAACEVGWQRVASEARAICVQNGHPPGSPGFDACFDRTFSTMGGGRTIDRR